MILDTNVISEIVKPSPDARVVHWYQTNYGDTCFMTTITEAELRFGLAFMPEGKKKAALEAALSVLLDTDFADRILAFERADTRHYASIMASRRKSGRPMTEMDAQIAAIAKRHKLKLVTRNVADFAHCGIEIINPWEARS